jgi:CysZ protein
MWFGLTLPTRALGTILRHPTLLFWSALPTSITLTIYFFLITRAQHAAKDAVAGYLATWGMDPHGWTIWLVMAFTELVLLLAGAVTFSVVSSIIASPFNDFLAESAERFTDPPLAPVAHVSPMKKVRLLLIDIAKTLAALVMTIAALLLSWVPVLNVLAFVLAFLLVTFQYVSYAQTRRGLGIGAGARFLWRHLFACAGFGAALSVLFAVPIVSALCVPLAVVGGTLLVGRSQAKGLR